MGKNDQVHGFILPFGESLRLAEGAPDRYANVVPRVLKQVVSERPRIVAPNVSRCTYSVSSSNLSSAFLHPEISAIILRLMGGLVFNRRPAKEIHPRPKVAFGVRRTAQHAYFPKMPVHARIHARLLIRYAQACPSFNPLLSARSDQRHCLRPLRVGASLADQ